MKTKICTKCNKLKPVNNFRKCKITKDGLQCWCNQCREDYYQANREKIVGKGKVWYKNNVEKCKQDNRKNHQKNRERDNKQSREYGRKHREKIVQNVKNWQKKHRKSINQRKREEYSLGISKFNNKDYFNNHHKKYFKNKYDLDINFRIYRIISSIISRSLKGNKHGRHWEDLVGWKLGEGMKYLESQFTLGMSWSNYGWYIDEHGVKQLGWEIDHIKAKSEFNITSYDCVNFKRLWALSNLRPMWATTRVINGIEYIGNRNKSNK